MSAFFKNQNIGKIKKVASINFCNNPYASFGTGSNVLVPETNN